MAEHTSPAPIGSAAAAVSGVLGGRLGRFTSAGTSTQRAVAFLVLVFVVSRAVTLALGFRYNVGWLSLAVQNIDQRLLRSHLAQSLWYLHGQPPLWNALVGLSLKTGNQVWPRLWHVVYLGLGLVETLAIFALLLQLRAPRRAALAVTAVITIAPATLVYESMFTYDYPTLVVLTVLALAVARFVTKPSFARGLLLFGLAGSLVLMRTMFQPAWFVLVLVLLLVVCRGHRRTVLLSSALPLALIVGVIAKNWFLFGVPSTTSWSGIMLSRATEVALPLSERRQLVHEGKLHNVSLVDPPQSTLQAYEAVGITPAPRTGVPLLDMPGDKWFPRNMENRTFIKISRLYWQDDLWIIEHRPGAYLRAVGKGVADYFAPPTINWTGQGDTGKLGAYNRWFSTIVYGRLGLSKDGAFLIAMYILAIVAGTWIAIRQLRPGADAATMIAVFALASILYVTVIGNLAEVGENYHFRILVDPFAAALAAVGIHRLILTLSHKRRTPAPT